MILNTYANVRQPQISQSITINDWLQQIKNSEYSDLITKARKGEIDYNQTKLSLPCITWNFTYNTYKKDTNIIDSTGLLYIDIDNPTFNINNLDKSKVYAYYKSFGGNGYSILIKIIGITPANFKHNYLIVCEELGIADYVDASAIKHSQYNILSYDEQLFINENSFQFTAVDVAPPTIVINKKREYIYTSEGGKIRFNNLDDINLEGNSYIVNWEGIEYINCFIPMKKREEGNRNSFLLSYTTNLVILNPHLSKEAIGKIIGHVNQKACYPPVAENKIYTVVESIFKYKEEGSLQPITFNKKRKFVFDSSLKLSRKEKLEIMNQELGKKKMNESQSKINDILLDWNFEKLGKITQRAIYNNHPISKKTIEKYWSDFKEYISVLNNDWEEDNKEYNQEEKVAEIEEKEPLPSDADRMLNEIKNINPESELWTFKRYHIQYVIENHVTLGDEGIEHFYNEIFKKEETK